MDNKTSNLHTCPDCRNQFVQPFVCTTCGAQKLYDETVRSQSETIDKLVAAVNRLCPHRGDMPAGMYETPCPKCLLGDSSVVETSVPSHEALADHLKTLTASTNCPVCGKSGMHEHTPTELIIYRNGVKYGRSLYEPRIGVTRLGQCEAIVPERWSQPAHRCEFQATTEINGKKLCGHHLKGSVEEPSKKPRLRDSDAAFNMGVLPTEQPEKASVRHLPTCNLNYIDGIGEGCDCGAENGRTDSGKV